MEKAMKARKIPSTDSIEELARFWDHHDLTDFEDQLEEVTAPVFSRRSTIAVTVRLRPDEAREVKRVAKTKRVREATLIRRWVVEKLRATAPSSKRR
jgi:CopG antitoxin of type II toxin-antitoxin system